MNRWHNYYPDNHAHFCTVSVYDRNYVFSAQGLNVLYEEWEKARRALSVKILAYCVMPNHIHLVLWAESGESIKKFLHRTLAQTSRRLQPGGGFWKERPRTIPIYSRAVLIAKVDYLHRNPLRKKLVENPEDWEHSSFAQVVLSSPFSPFRCDSWDGVLI